MLFCKKLKVDGVWWWNAFFMVISICTRTEMQLRLWCKCKKRRKYFYSIETTRNAYRWYCNSILANECKHCKSEWENRQNKLSGVCSNFFVPLKCVFYRFNGKNTNRDWNQNVNNRFSCVRAKTNRQSSVHRWQQQQKVSTDFLYTQPLLLLVCVRF